MSSPDPIWCFKQLQDPLWRVLKSQALSTNSVESPVCTVQHSARQITGMQSYAVTYTEVKTHVLVHKLEQTHTLNLHDVTSSCL